MIYYIYALICPIERDIKYIGLTHIPEQRIRQHIQNSGSCSIMKEYWISWLKQKGMAPKFVILGCYINSAEAKRKELQLIDSMPWLMNGHSLRMNHKETRELRSLVRNKYIKELNLSPSTIIRRCRNKAKGYFIEPL